MKTVKLLEIWHYRCFDSIRLIFVCPLLIFMTITCIENLKGCRLSLTFFVKTTNGSVQYVWLSFVWTIRASTCFPRTCTCISSVCGVKLKRRVNLSQHAWPADSVREMRSSGSGDLKVAAGFVDSWVWPELLSSFLAQYGSGLLAVRGLSWKRYGEGGICDDNSESRGPHRVRFYHSCWPTYVPSLRLVLALTNLFQSKRSTLSDAQIRVQRHLHLARGWPHLKTVC